MGLDALGVDPDVLVLSKAIGGGLPIAVDRHRAELHGLAARRPCGNVPRQPARVAAGAATIRHIVEHERRPRRRDRRAAAARASRADEGVPEVADVRGHGLMVGVELVDRERWMTRVPAARRSARERRAAAMLELGVLVEIGGRDGAVVRFLPPLIIEAEHVDRIAEAFGKAVWSAWRAR